MKCPYCGTEVKTKSNFCPECGANLSTIYQMEEDGDKMDTQESTQTQVSKNSTQDSANPTQTQDNIEQSQIPNSSSNNKDIKNAKDLALWSFIISLIGLVIAGIPCGIASIVIAICAITKIKSQNAKISMALPILAIIFGVLDIVAVILLW